MTDSAKSTAEDETMVTQHDLLDWWQCADCDKSGHRTVSRCPNCGGMQLSSCTGGVDLPPCWKEDVAGAAATGVERLWVHLDGPGFIGMEGGEVELVRADIQRGEEPDPEVRPATAENVRELAEQYNSVAYGSENENTVSTYDE